MTSGRSGLEVTYGSRFERRLRALPQARRDSCLRAVEALATDRPTPGMRVKPILPGKFYNEARISSGDRLIFRIAAGVLYLIDVVTHDEIARYSGPTGR
jgi:hypothetical protein